MRAVNYYWRLLATAIAFSSFGIGGVLIPLLATPLLFLLPGDKARRQLRARRLIHYTFKAFVYFMRTLGILHWRSDHIEQLRRPGLLIVANHPTLLDVVFLVAFLPSANCIVKSGLRRNPAMRGFISLTGYITNDNGEALLSQARRSLADGVSLLIFPEGTRSVSGQPPQFQRGAANLAVRLGVNLSPVVIRCSPPTLSKQHKWYDIPDRRFLMTFTVLPDVLTAPYSKQPAPRAVRQLTRRLETFFAEELNADEHHTTGTRNQENDHRHATA